jgi:putative Mn2+ efflux pump MntP
MPTLEILGLAVGLALDAFAVAIVSGSLLPRITARHYFRLGFHFGLFQGMMPVLGWLAGRSISGYVAAWDHWIAFALLVLVGGKMLATSSGNQGDRRGRDPTRGMSLVIFCIATSIDALAVGFSLAILGVKIVRPALIIGVVTCALTLAGLRIGGRVGAFIGPWAERIGGVVLIGIAVKIVAEHLSS